MKAQAKAKDRLRKAAFRGLLYEELVCNSLQKLLPDWQVTPSLWFEYGTVHGDIHQCEMDLVLMNKRVCLVVEIKQTQVPRAIEELQGLYLPIAQMEWGATHKVGGVCLFGSVTGKFDRGFRLGAFAQKVARGARAGIGQWHWPTRTIDKSLSIGKIL